MKKIKLLMSLSLLSAMLFGCVAYDDDYEDDDDERYEEREDDDEEWDD